MGAVANSGDIGCMELEITVSNKPHCAIHASHSRQLSDKGSQLNLSTTSQVVCQGNKRLPLIEQKDFYCEIHRGCVFSGGCFTSRISPHKT